MYASIKIVIKSGEEILCQNFYLGNKPAGTHLITIDDISGIISPENKLTLYFSKKNIHSE